MAIEEANIKFLASKRLTDTADGGGAMTGTVVVDGQDNNVFDDVSHLDRVYGNVSLRKVFGAVVTNNTDKYLGARVIIDKPPADENVHGLIFAASAVFDTRSEVTAKVESYLAPGGAYQGLLYGNHLAGMSTVMLIQKVDRELPTIGQVLLLRKNEDLANEYDQYVRLTEVASQVLTFTDDTGDFQRRVVTCGTSDPLRESFNGFQPQRIDTNISYVGKTRIFDTIVADAAQYYGIRPLDEAITAGAFNIKADTVFSNLLPSAQIETPISDSRTNQVSAALVPAGGKVTLTTSLIFSPTQKLFIGGGIVPGTVSVSRSGVVVTDSGGVIFNGANEVGAIDYENGILSLSTDVFGGSSGIFSIEYQPGARPDFIDKSVGIPVSINNRSLSWTLTLESVPAKGSLSVSYLANGRWYVLRDNGAGELTGSDTSLGAGFINFATGTMVVTLGALPDVGGAIVLNWSEQVLAPPSNNTELLNGGKLFFVFNSNGELSDTPAKPLAPNTVSISWTHNSVAKTATDNGSGTITGDATGTVNYVTGVVRLSPNVLPPIDTVFSMSNSITTATPSASPVNLFGGSVGANVKPRTISFPCQITVQHAATNADTTVQNSNIAKTVTVLDDGSGNLVFSDGTNGNKTIGSVNYSTGVITLNSNVTLGNIDMEGALVTDKQYYYVYSSGYSSTISS